jgi:hypothetical protein
MMTEDMQLDGLHQHHTEDAGPTMQLFSPVPDLQFARQCLLLIG